MKLNKFFVVGVMSIFAAFTSCDTESYDNYEPGAPAGQYNVTFVDEGAIVLAKTATDFTVTLSRESTEGELTVPVIVNSANMFDVPASATFSAGSATTEITVKVADNVELNKSYFFSIRVDEAFANCYKEQTAIYEYTTTVTKEDYELSKKATFLDNFWSGEEFDVDVEYSPALNIYRIKDLFAEGVHLYYKVNEDNSVEITASNGEVITKWATGLNHPTYGDITAQDLGSSFNIEDNYIELDFQWNVSAGSFGEYPCYIMF